jgi:hypothetical protein
MGGSFAPAFYKRPDGVYAPRHSKFFGDVSHGGKRRGPRCRRLPGEARAPSHQEGRSVGAPSRLKPVFKSPAAFRAWLARHHRRARSCWSGLQARHREAEPDLARVSGRSAVLRLDRRNSPPPRRRPLHDSLHPSQARKHLECREPEAHPGAHQSRSRACRRAEVFQDRDRKRSGLYSFEQRREVKLPASGRSCGQMSGLDQLLRPGPW